jgi:hypothetical protein
MATGSLACCNAALGEDGALQMRAGILIGLEFIVPEPDDKR